MPKCTYCDRPAHVQITQGGTTFDLCLDCRVKYEQAECLEQVRTITAFNAVAAVSNATVGIPGLVPRLQVPNIRPLQTGDCVLTTININDSAIGVLNLGSVQRIDSAIATLNRQSATEVADAIRAVTEAVANNEDLDSAVRNQVVELLDSLSGEATAPPESRRTHAALSLIGSIGSAIGGVGALAQLWGQYKAVILEWFS